MFKLLIRRIMTVLTHSVGKFIIVVIVFEKNWRLHKFASTRLTVTLRTNTPFNGNVVGRSDSSRRQTGKGPKPTASRSADLIAGSPRHLLSPRIILNSKPLYS